MWSIGLFFVLNVAALISARSVPVHSGLVMYQAYPGYYSPQRSMYVQYSGNRRSAALEQGGVAAYAAGDRIATGTYYKGNQNDDQFRKGEADTENEDEYTSSVAEAYPAGEPGQQDEEQVEQADEEAEVYSVTKRIPKGDLPKEIKNRKNKPKVQLADSDEDEDDEDDDDQSFAKARPASKGGKNTNTYFPIHFGETSGGAIAIANSFSKGKGGTAVSRATAYGSPADTKTKKTLTHNQ